MVCPRTSGIEHHGPGAAQQRRRPTTPALCFQQLGSGDAGTLLALQTPRGHPPRRRRREEAQEADRDGRGRGGGDPAHHARALAPEARRPDGREERDLDRLRSSAVRCCARCAGPGRSCPRRSAGSRRRPTGASSGSSSCRARRSRRTRSCSSSRNPELERDALDAESQLRAAQAELVNVRAQADRQSGPAGRGRDGALRLPPGRAAGGDERGLDKEGLVAELTVKLSRVARRGARDAQRHRGSVASPAWPTRRRRRSPSRRPTSSS